MTDPDAGSRRVIRPKTGEDPHLLAERAGRGSRERFLELLARAPDVEPEPFDRLSADEPPPPPAPRD